MNCFKARRLLIREAAGDLTPRESQDLAGHLAGCSRCAEELEDLRQTCALFAGARPAAVEPSAGFAARIEEKILAESRAPSGTRRTFGAWAWNLGTTAAAAMLVIVGITAMLRYTPSEEDYHPITAVTPEAAQRDDATSSERGLEKAAGNTSPHPAEVAAQSPQPPKAVPSAAPSARPASRTKGVVSAGSGRQTAAGGRPATLGLGREAVRARVKEGSAGERTWAADSVTAFGGFDAGARTLDETVSPAPSMTAAPKPASAPARSAGVEETYERARGSGAKLYAYGTSAGGAGSLRQGELLERYAGRETHWFWDSRGDSWNLRKPAALDKLALGDSPAGNYITDGAAALGFAEGFGVAGVPMMRYGPDGESAPLMCMAATAAENARALEMVYTSADAKAKAIFDY